MEYCQNYEDLSASLIKEQPSQYSLTYDRTEKANETTLCANQNLATSSRHQNSSQDESNSHGNEYQQLRLIKRRYRATQRERIRMHSLNQAFDQLRSKLSFLPIESRRSLSKQKTLTLARHYIVELGQILQDYRNASISVKHLPQTLN